MSEIKQSQNDPGLFMISPEKVEFNLDTDNISELSSSTEKISKETEMKIINKSEDFIAIKIKTNKQSNYILTPPSLILSPKEEKIIKIRFNRNEGENLEDFLFLQKKKIKIQMNYILNILKEKSKM